MQWVCFSYMFRYISFSSISFVIFCCWSYFWIKYYIPIPLNCKKKKDFFSVQTHKNIQTKTSIRKQDSNGNIPHTNFWMDFVIPFSMPRDGGSQCHSIQSFAASRARMAALFQVLAVALLSAYASSQLHQGLSWRSADCLCEIRKM